jgi:hypothetical protein
MNSDKPGLPDYTGPSQGWFAYIHHEQQLEWSHQISERVSDVVANKPAHEQPIRLACLTHIPTARVPGTYHAARHTYDTAQQAYHAAVRAYHDTGRTGRGAQAYNTARQVYDTARQAYYAAVQAYDTEIAALVAELVPDAPWNGHALVFPPEQKEPTQ